MKLMNMKKILISGVFALSLVGCDLTTSDQSSLTPGTALDNPAGVQSAVLSAYRRLHEFDFYGQQANLHGDAFADNIEIVNRTGRYEQEWIGGVGVYANRWGVCYRVINDANYVLQFLPALNVALVPSSTGFTSQQVVDNIKGEALFVRSLAYMELLRVYSYEPGKEVNGFNLGVVLRDKPTQVVSDADNKSRSTNVQCYQFVETSLLEAITLLAPASQLAGASWPASLGANTFPFRATKGAAHALLARLYLYWGRYADADTQATTALTLLPTATPVTAANFVASWSTATHPESIFELEIRATDWSGVDGANNSMHSMTQNAISGSQYVMSASEELIAAHEATDVRRNVYVNTTATLNKPQVRKWPGEKGSYVENIPVIRRAEMYLIQAESRARQGADATAQAAINILRSNRGLPDTALTGTALIDLIMNERRVELAFEGHRFFDLKRLGLEIPKTAASGVANISYTDFRLLQQLPNDQVRLNPNLQQNPGY